MAHRRGPAPVGASPIRSRTRTCRRSPRARRRSRTGRRRCCSCRGRAGRSPRRGRGGGLAETAAGVAPAMSRASLTITPAKPSSVRSSAEDGRAHRRRLVRIELGQQDVRGHHHPYAGLDRRGERDQLALAELGRRPVDDRQGQMGVQGRVAVPGEVLGRGGHAGGLQPADPGGAVPGHAVGRVAEAATPITGLSGLELMSTLGAKFRLTPVRRRQRADLARRRTRWCRGRRAGRAPRCPATASPAERRGG